MPILRTILWPLVALSAALGAPAAAQQASVFSHAASRAAFPRAVGEQTIAQTRDLNTPNDSVVDYAGVDPRESTTLYIFRAAYPDARLWFGQASDVVGTQIPLRIFDAGEEERIAAFGSAVPNAIQRIYTTTQDGPFRTTALVVGQAGEWVVKMRVTSPTLDRAGMAARIRAFADAIRFPEGTAFAPAAGPLPACGPLPFPQGARPVEPDVQRLAIATGLTAALAADARRPLANGGAGWCRVEGNRSDPPLLIVRRADGTGGWIFLLGDAGRAIAAKSAAEIDLPNEGTAVIAAADADSVRAAAIYDEMPDPATPLAHAAQVLSGRAPALIEVGRRPNQPQPQKR
jgi:hypothetical protein